MSDITISEKFVQPSSSNHGQLPASVLDCNLALHDKLEHAYSSSRCPAGELPLWDEEEQLLIWVDMEASISLSLLSPKTLPELTRSLAAFARSALYSPPGPQHKQAPCYPKPGILHWLLLPKRDRQVSPYQSVSQRSNLSNPKMDRDLILRGLDVQSAPNSAGRKRILLAVDV